MKTPLLVSLLLCCSCGLDVVEVPVSGQATVPGSPLSGVLLVPALDVAGFNDVHTSFARELDNQGVDEGDIDSVTLKSVSVAAEPGRTLDFIDSIQIFVAAPGQPEVRIAEKHVPDGAARVDLDVLGEELAPYVTASSMTLRTSVDGTQPAEDEHLEFDAVFEVDVKVGPF